jgi:hypothetical protein
MILFISMIYWCSHPGEKGYRCVVYAWYTPAICPNQHQHTAHLVARPSSPFRVSPDDEVPTNRRSPLSAKLAMYGESLAPERKLMKRGSWVEMLRVRSVSPRFMRGGRARTSGSPRVRDTHMSEFPKSTNISPSRIRQPKRLISDNGTSFF